jgi:transcriptional regulator with XRE-family HTH domain
MSLEGRVRERVEKKRQDPEYQAEKLSLAVTEEIARLMVEQEVSKADLARRLGVSKARVTHLLNGTPNMTLKTIAAASAALGTEVSLRLERTSASDPATGRKSVEAEKEERDLPEMVGAR